MRYTAWLICTAIIVLGSSAAPAETVYGQVYDTLHGKIYKNTKVTLNSTPPKEATTNEQGQYWLHDVKPGAYLVQIMLPNQDVVGRLVVYKIPTTIANLDLSKIESPSEDDAY